MIKNLSPLDVCTLATKAPTATVLADPLEAIINAVGKFAPFATGGAGANSMSSIAERKPLDMPGFGDFTKSTKGSALDAFEDLNGDLQKLASEIYDQQKKRDARYVMDVQSIANFLNSDLRGANYLKFTPDFYLDFATPAVDPSECDANAALCPVIAAQSGLLQARADAQAMLAPPTSPPEAGWVSIAMLENQMSADLDLMTDMEPQFSGDCRTKLCGGDASLVERELEQAKAAVAVIAANDKSLQTDQTAIVTAWRGLQTVATDYKRRIDPNTGNVHVVDGFLQQLIAFPADYEATAATTLTCVSDATAKATTDAINISVLYQNLPTLTFSAGILTSLQPKNNIGIVAASPPNGTAGNYFGVTDNQRAQVIPMAFLNFRVPPGPHLSTLFKFRETELAITNNASAGIGVNSNSGTNQVEYFAGDAIGFNRVLLHFGVHLGRKESLGGGFILGQAVPPGVSAAPINWSFSPAFAFGLSVRVAPF